jgi:hypothetical protein
MFGFLGGEFTPPTFTSLPEDALAVLLGVNRVTDFHQHQVEFIHSGELSGALVYGRLIDRQLIIFFIFIVVDYPISHASAIGG